MTNRQWASCRLLLRPSSYAHVAALYPLPSLASFVEFLMTDKWAYIEKKKKKEEDGGGGRGRRRRKKKKLIDQSVMVNGTECRTNGWVLRRTSNVDDDDDDAREAAGDDWDFRARDNGRLTTIRSGG